MSEFKTIIGLEVHAQLNTKSKMFCSCSNIPLKKAWVKDYLQKKNVEFDFVEHEAVTRPINSAKARGVHVGQIAKALVYIYDGKPIIFILPGDRKLDESKAGAVLECTNLRMAKPEEVREFTNCIVGLVPPIIEGVQKIVDNALLENDILSFNAGIKTAGIKINKNEFLKVLDKYSQAEISSDQLIVEEPGEEKRSSDESSEENENPNTRICPICMAMPGTLPVANIEAIKKTIKTGLALGCKINEISKFDRKHYFYPDLPKGYQISQYDQPFCVGGELEVEGKNIHFNRIHLEEDAGKLIHPKGSKYTIVDLNRAGTPLMEMVTEPDIHSPLIAKLFLQELQQILRSLQVSSADMEKGHMRCDANISVVKDGKSSPIIELKNLNSFKFVEKALIFEAKRLRNEFESFDGKMNKQTRRFDATTGKTLAMREKEEAKDYRYFPEPDVPPFVIAKAKEIDLEKIKEELNDLPSVVRMRLSERGISSSDAAQIYKNKPVLELLEKCLEIDNKYLARIAKILINERSAVKLSAKDLVLLAKTAEDAKMTSNILRAMIEQAAKGEKSVSEIIEESKTDSDGSDISEIVEKVLSQNAEAVEKYRAGKTEVTGFLIGQVMRDSRGKANPNEIREEIIRQIGG